MQLRRRREDATNLVRHPWHHIWRAPAECGHVADVDLGLAVGQIAPVDMVSPRALEKWIVDVGHVLYVLHARPARFDVSDQNVEDREREGVAHVA